MKEIKYILEKLSDLSDSGTGNTVLDIDLMLDYSRKLYDILLSERKKIIPDASLQTTNIIPVDEQSTTPKSVLGTDTEASELKSTDSTEETTIPTSTNYNVAQEPIVSEQKPSLLISENVELEREEQLYAHESNISFEPPHPPEEQPFHPEEGIEEDKPEENNVPIQSIPVPLNEEEPLSDYAQIFNYASKPQGSPTSSDIRKMIGINDKYLFLNELFNSQKRAYEDTLDKLNSMTEYKEAVTWIKNEIAPFYKWYEDDETVLDFYDTLAKHFSAR